MWHVFDPVPPIFYALICASLALAAPILGTTWSRVAAGVCVGVVASLVLPVLRGTIGF